MKYTRQQPENRFMNASTNGLTGQAQKNTLTWNF